MKRRTKIVCTLGPAVDSREKIKALLDAGMNVARLNCSHGDWDTRRQWTEWIRELSGEVAPCAILVDLQGPKFRIGEVENKAITIKPGQTVTVGPVLGAAIPIHQPEILAAMGPNCRVLLGDGDVELKLGALKEGNFDARAVSGGTVKSRQGVTLVGKIFDTPAMTDKDRNDVYEACRIGADFIALSYVKNAADLRELRRLVDTYDKQIRLCAKIETREALKHLDEILKMSDVVMVARGDLGLQMELEEVPLAQKRIIKKCNDAGKPVITATQMLESMTKSPRPTRAEAADVANAIFDGTDAVMLSGETAAGEYPIEAAKTMAKIAIEAETIFDYEERIEEFQRRRHGKIEPTEAVAHSVALMALLTDPDAIITTTTSGQTARLVSKYRPDTPILCATWDSKTHRQMAVVWGVEAICIDLPSDTDDIVSHAMDGFLRHRRLKVGDQTIVTAGIPAGSPGNTNLILMQTVK